MKHFKTKEMKLSKKVVDEILTNLELRLKLALELMVTEQAIRNNANRNEDNNKLTTVLAVNLIKSETGLTEDEIFETEKTNA